MKVLMVLDQTRTGLGGKESPDLAIGGKPMAIGSYHMFEKTLTNMGGSICTILYYGDGTFVQDPDTNGKGFAAMNKKLNPDVIICGLCLNYGNYGKMAAETAQTTNGLTDMPTFTIMSEKYSTAIDEFEDHVTILKMPRRGDTGLPQSLAMMCEFALKLVKKEDVSKMIRGYAYQ